MNKKIEPNMSVAEIRILRWISGVIREEKIIIKYIRGSIVVAPIIDIMRENKLR